MLISALLICTSSIAQNQEEGIDEELEIRTDFTEEELKSFISVYKKATEIQEKEQEVMVAAIKKYDLKVDRFNEILTAQQQKKLEEIKLTEEERDNFKSAVIEVIKIQKNARDKAGEHIEEQLGMDIYQQITLAYREDIDFKMKLDRLMKDSAE